MRVRSLSAALLVVAILMAAALVAGRETTPQTCDPNHTISWPASNPVWQMCWVSPSDSSGVDGSGLEITSVFYNGKLVMSRGHIPVLNVKYDPGGCGGSDLTYRDWADELSPFEANNVIRPGYAEPTVTPRTVCDHPGTDAGSFAGVAVEKLADRLILTTQIQAGWYRYTQTWTFFLDGTFEPGLRFTAVNNTCTPLAHYHNVYWRMDFDIGDAANDAIDEYNSGFWNVLTTEAQRLHSPGTERKWRVRDTVSGSGFELVPGHEADVADAWGVADFWGLTFKSGELDDGGGTGVGGDGTHTDRYVTGENIVGKDVVLWYRVGFRHAGPADCEISGPTLRPISIDPRTLSVDDVTVTEGNAGTADANFTVSLSSAGSNTVTVNYATADVTAIAGSDYVAKAGTLTFPPGATSQTVSVAVIGDTLAEFPETFVVNLSGATNASIADGQGQGTIANDDAPAGMAAYDPVLRAPKCGTVGSACDSGAALLNGRDGKGPEPNQPNTINNSCPDGTSGTYHGDESVDRLKVSTLDGLGFAPGKIVRVDATVWAWTNPALDTLELYYAPNAANPSWTLISRVVPTGANAQTISVNYTLPSGGLQAVRARFRYQGAAGACVPAAYDDQDDLIFAVGGSAPPPPDTTPPVVSIASPAGASFVGGTVTIAATASDNSGVVANVQFLVDGAALGGPDTAAPFTAAWPTGGSSNGSHVLTARATDGAGNQATSAPVSVTVDNVPPSASITSPTGGTVSGTITVSGTASDSNGIASVQFRVDGLAVGAPDTSAPYSVPWNTASAANGTHVLTAVATDVAGNPATSAGATVTVSNSWAVPAGLVAAYTFSEGTGPTTADVSGNGNIGTLAGGTARSPAGRFGNALLFDGVNDLVSVADAATLDLTTGMTIEAWVNPSVLSGWRTVALKSVPGGLTYALYAHDGAPRPAGTINTGGSDLSAFGTAALPLNTWTHLAVTFGGGALRLYVNGVLVRTQAATGALRTSANALTIGGNTVWSEWFAGLIDEVRIYNRALTQGEIQAGMSQTLGGG